MLDIRLIREQGGEVERALARRGGAYGIAGLRALDGRRLALLREGEELKRRRNEISRLVGERKKSGQPAGDEQAEARGLGERIKSVEDELGRLEEESAAALLSIPNLPHESIPDGAGPQDNVTTRQWGEVPRFAFTPRSHVEIGEALGILDMEAAARLTGARFSLLRGAGAALSRALINFMLDLHTRQHGYAEVAPPAMVNTKTMTGTGQLPKFAEDLFKIQNTDYWLIPTAEVPLTNLYGGQILELAGLPLSLTAYTPCFRAEAGSYGKDTVGLIRQHQFDKVELVKFTAPEQAPAGLEDLTGHAERVLQLLGLPYRVVTLCAADLGFSAAKTYDLEVWVPSQDTYREISSCSWFTDFQARRINIRFRRGPKDKPEFVHTLNGSGLAVGRTIVAILENFQNADGSVTVPPPLRPYMGGLEVIR